MSPLDLETLRGTARLAGFDLTPSELQAIRPAVERALQALARLEGLPLEGVEPVTHDRVV